MHFLLKNSFRRTIAIVPKVSSCVRIYPIPDTSEAPYEVRVSGDRVFQHFRGMFEYHGIKHSYGLSISRADVSIMVSFQVSDRKFSYFTSPHKDESWEIGTHKYFEYNCEDQQFVSWNQAEETCRSRSKDGHLISIHDVDENADASESVP